MLLFKCVSPFNTLHFLKCVGPFNIGRKKRSPQDTRFFINSNQVVIIVVVIFVIVIVVLVVVFVFIIVFIYFLLFRASVETLLAAPSVHFSTGEAKRLLEPYCIQMIPFLCPVVQIILIRKKAILPAQFWAIM